MIKAAFLKGFGCINCIGNVVGPLKAIDGIQDATVDVDQAIIQLELTKDLSDEFLTEAIARCGYEVERIIEV